MGSIWIYLDLSGSIWPVLAGIFSKFHLYAHRSPYSSIGTRWEFFRRKLSCLMLQHLGLYSEKQTHLTASQPETCLKSFPSIPSALHEAIFIEPDYHRRREAINFTLSFFFLAPPPSPQFLSLHPLISLLHARMNVPPGLAFMHSKERPASPLQRSSPNNETHRSVGGHHWTGRWDVGRRLGPDASLNSAASIPSLQMHVVI